MSLRKQRRQQKRQENKQQSAQHPDVDAIRAMDKENLAQNEGLVARELSRTERGHQLFVKLDSLEEDRGPLTYEQWRPLVTETQRVLEDMADGREEITARLHAELKLSRGALHTMELMELKMGSYKNKIAKQEDLVAGQSTAMERMGLCIRTLEAIVEQKKSEKSSVEERLADLEKKYQSVSSQLVESRRAHKECNHQMRQMKTGYEKKIASLKNADDASRLPSCAICFEERQACAFQCGHTGCRQCLATLQVCHICRLTVSKESIITLHQ